MSVGHQEKPLANSAQVERKMLPNVSTQPYSLTYVPEKKNEDYDSCTYLEELKSTIIAIRKTAKITGEPIKVTRAKIDAVRNHDRSNGDVVVYINETHIHLILIRKYVTG